MSDEVLIEKWFSLGTTFLLDGVLLKAGTLAATSEGRTLLGKCADALNSPFAKEYVLEAVDIGKLTLEEGAETVNMAIEVVEKNPKLLSEGKSITQVFQEVTNDVIKNNPSPSNTLVQGATVDTGLFSNLKLIGDNIWQSPGRLIYGRDEKFGNRFNHILEHLVPNSAKKMHSVFSVSRDKIVELLDEAWAMRGKPLVLDPGAYLVDMKRIIGTNGESAIRIVVKPGTTEIITAYPVKL